MRKLLILATLFVFCTTAMAFAAESKIVSCDLQKVAENSEPFKSAQATAKKTLQPIKKHLDERKKAIENDIKAAGPTPEKSKRDAILKRQEQYMKDATAFLRRVQESELTVRQDMDAMILEAAKNYAIKNKDVLVVDARSILYSDPSFTIEDITEAITKEVNAVWRALPKK